MAKKYKSSGPKKSVFEACTHGNNEMRAEVIFFGMLVAILGLVWLLSEQKIIAATFSFPPVVVLVVGLQIIFLGIKYHPASK
jgi:hypothetical protein